MDGTGEPAGAPVAPTPVGSQPPVLSLAGLSLERPDGTVAVRGLDLQVARGEVHVLLGRPGSGASTVLRLVNRLVEPTGGRILLDGTDVTVSDPVALRRRIGWVGRTHGLLPHRTVADNLATVPRLLGWKRARIRARVEELLDLVGLEPGTYRGRHPAALSAPERALVALTRAVAAEPVLLLADEPFAGLEPADRDLCRERFRALRSALGVTVLFATHDVAEALELGDRIAVLSGAAELDQDADPATLLADPATDAVAELVGPHRGIRRLALTPLHAIALAQPATVRAGDRPSFASARLSSVGATWGVVVELDETAVGWVGVDDLRAGSAQETVAPLVRPLPGTATVAESTLDALARTLLVPEGWVAVLDGRRYVGILDRAGLPPVTTPLATTPLAATPLAAHPLATHPVAAHPVATDPVT